MVRNQALLMSHEKVWACMAQVGGYALSFMWLYKINLTILQSSDIFAGNHESRAQKIRKRSLPLWVRVDDFHILQLFKDVSGNRATALAEMGWATAIPLAPSIDPPESTNTKAASEVDFPCHRSWHEIREQRYKHYMDIKLLVCALLGAINRRRNIEESLTSSDVVPIRVIWGKLLECTGLHNIRPMR